MFRCAHDSSRSRACRVARVTVALCLASCLTPGLASKAPGTEALESLLSFTDLAATTASNDSIAFLNSLAATVQHTAQSGLQILANAPSRFAEAFGRSQAIVSTQYASTPLSAVIQHPFPAYPDTLFTWAVCGTYNPYLIISVRDQEVPLIGVGQPVNESVLSFAISSWSEIAYHDPSLTQYQFKIAEDLIYDIGNDTFAVATPFDVKNGRGQIPGVSAVGHSTHNSSVGASSEDDDYHIKFTFAASPLSNRAPIPDSANNGSNPAAARNVSAPGAGVQRLLTGQIKDTDIKGRATDAFTELVARLYFNIATAALGNPCNPGYAALVPVASYMIKRLKALSSNDTTYYNLPLDEELIDDGDGRLCLQESNTLYNAVSMVPISTTIAFSAHDCCHACRLTEQANVTVVCNAWIYCGVSGGCHNATANFGASKNTCSLYHASDLDYNVPLDKNVGVVRGPNVTFTSGRTQAVIPDSIMSILVPPRESTAAPIDKTASFQQTWHRLNTFGGNN